MGVPVIFNLYSREILFTSKGITERIIDVYL